MHAYRDEVKALQQRCTDQEAELEAAEAEITRLNALVRGRDDQIDALRRRFDGAPSAESARRLKRLATAAGVVALLSVAVTVVVARGASKSVTAAEAVLAEARPEAPEPAKQHESGKARDLAPGEKVFLADPAKNPGAAMMMEAQRLQTAGRWPEAERAWRTALELEDNPNYRFELGTLLLERGKQAEAIAEFERAIRDVESGEGRGWLWKAHFYIGKLTEKSDPRRAVRAYEEFLRISESDNPFRSDAGRALDELGQP